MKSSQRSSTLGIHGCQITAPAQLWLPAQPPPPRTRAGHGRHGRRLPITQTVPFLQYSSVHVKSPVMTNPIDFIKRLTALQASAKLHVPALPPFCSRRPGSRNTKASLSSGQIGVTTYRFYTPCPKHNSLECKMGGSGGGVCKSMS